MRPAIDFSLSVSIIGGKAQPPALRELSRTLRADYQHYTELVRLSRLQTNLSGEAEAVLGRGEAILAVLQQGQHVPASLAETIVLLYSLQGDRLARIAREGRDRFVRGIFPFVSRRNPALAGKLDEGAALTAEMRRALDGLLDDYLAGGGEG